jgi:hypothetical protein
MGRIISYQAFLIKSDYGDGVRFVLIEGPYSTEPEIENNAVSKHHEPEPPACGRGNSSLCFSVPYGSARI